MDVRELQKVEAVQLDEFGTVIVNTSSCS